MARCLVIGSSGQVATALRELKAPGFDWVFLGRPDFNLGNPSGIAETIAQHEPDVVINAAAYTAVDKAESEEAAAFSVNSAGAGLVAEGAARAGAPIIHLSTDYVFDGTKSSPFAETDSVNPISAYGRTKLEGERRVAKANPRHVILRTSWVFAPYGQNFVRTMLRLAETRGEIGVVADQLGNPTYAPDLAQAIRAIAVLLCSGAGTGETSGIFHLTGTGEASWADLAEAVFTESAALGGPAARVKRINAAEYPTAATRPSNSRLFCAKARETFGVELPNWRAGVADCVRRILRPESALKEMA